MQQAIHRRWPPTDRTRTDDTANVFDTIIQVHYRVLLQAFTRSTTESKVGIHGCEARVYRVGQEISSPPPTECLSVQRQESASSNDACGRRGDRDDKRVRPVDGSSLGCVHFCARSHTRRCENACSCQIYCENEIPGTTTVVCSFFLDASKIVPGNKFLSFALLSLSIPTKYAIISVVARGVSRDKIRVQLMFSGHAQMTWPRHHHRTNAYIHCCAHSPP